jgi:hypothetical protein
MEGNRAQTTVDGNNPNFPPDRLGRANPQDEPRLVRDDSPYPPAIASPANRPVVHAF